MDAYGTVERLWRYPVKGLAGEALDRAELTEDGLCGDRAAALVGRDRDRPRAGKPLRGKEIARLHLATDLASGEAAAREAGWDVEPAWDGPYFDARPVSLIWTTWLTELTLRIRRPIDPLRFRANILVRTADGGRFAEADLPGRTLCVGSAVLRVLEPIVRCVVPARDLASGIPEADVQRAIVAERGNIFGVYAIVIQPGAVAVGDAVVHRR